MEIRSICLKDFRSWNDLLLEFGHVNVLVGPNAQGKSNILEAIYLLGTGKSFRRSKDSEMISVGCSAASIKGLVVHDSIKRTLQVKLGRRRRKTAVIDDKNLRRLSELLQYIQVVVFAPENLSLVQGGPRERRNYLDVQVARRNPLYLDTLIDYGRVCAQRSAVLKEYYGMKDVKLLLEPLTEQLINMGTTILRGRLSILPELEMVTGEIHRKITGGSETLALSYESNLNLDRLFDRSDLIDMMRHKLQESVLAELSQCRNLIGPHRDDLKITLDGFDVRRFGSQGQKRSVAVSLKMAEVELVWRSVGFYPVLLMDDVFSELDLDRSEGIINLMNQGPQIILTTTNAEKIPGNLGDNAYRFMVSEGEVLCER